MKIRKRDSDETLEMVTGELRNHNVLVGEHVASWHDSREEVLSHFEKKYNPEELSGHNLLLAAAASHHRLVWIHSFADLYPAGSI